MFSAKSHFNTDLLKNIITNRLGVIEVKLQAKDLKGSKHRFELAGFRVSGVSS